MRARSGAAAPAQSQAPATAPRAPRAPPPDYVRLVQDALREPTPTHEDISRFWECSAKRSLSRDHTASAMCACLLSSALLYNISVLWRLTQTEATEMAGVPVSTLIASATGGVWWVLAHVLLELAYMYYVSREPTLYRRHRTEFIMVARTGLLLLMIYYIPKTYVHTLPLEVHAGRAAAATYRVVTGFVAVSTLEVLSFRLPTRHAVPYHIARMGLSLLTLPETLKAFGKHPAVADAACSLWDSIGQLYLGAASYALGTPLLPDEAPVGRTSQNGGDLCTVLVLLLFLDLSVGLLVPLYVLYMREVGEFRAFMAAGGHSGGGSRSSSNSSMRSGNSSSSSGHALTSGSGMGASHGASGGGGEVPHSEVAAGERLIPHGSFIRSAAAARAAAARQAESSSSSGTSGSSAGINPTGGGVRQGGAGGVGIQGSQQPGRGVSAPLADTRPGDRPSEPAAAAVEGVSLHPGYGDVWPGHFRPAMHVVLLFCCTGVMWAVTSALWGIWQRRAGEGRCFIPSLSA